MTPRGRDGRVLTRYATSVALLISSALVLIGSLPSPAFADTYCCSGNRVSHTFPSQTYQIEWTLCEDYFCGYYNVSWYMTSSLDYALYCTPDCGTGQPYIEWTTDHYYLDVENTDTLPFTVSPATYHGLYDSGNLEENRSPNTYPDIGGCISPGRDTTLCGAWTPSFGQYLLNYFHPTANSVGAVYPSANVNFVYGTEAASYQFY